MRLVIPDGIITRTAAAMKSGLRGTSEERMPNVAMAKVRTKKSQMKRALARNESQSGVRSLPDPARSLAFESRFPVIEEDLRKRYGDPIIHLWPTAGFGFERPETIRQMA